MKALGERIVRQTANIKAGEVVVINGGKHTLPLMEQIAAEVHRRGGHPHMVIESDVAIKALWHEAPETNLADYPKHIVALYKQADLVLNLPGSENFREIFEDVDPKRFAIAGSNSENVLNELSTGSHSEIGISFPTKQEAEYSGIDFNLYEKMHWAAVNTDYKPIADKGTLIIGMLKQAKNVKITTKAGTNISFSMGDRHVFADDGILSEEERNSKIFFARFASLPGGWMDFAPVENSVNGTVIVPRSRCQFEPMSDISFLIKNGVVESLKAKQGAECYAKQMAPHTGDKNTVSVFTLGLNPEMKVIQEGKTDFRTNTAAGFITLNIGGNNSQYNGKVLASGGFNFPIVNPTLEIDGKVVIKDGKLML